jgi:VWFA-related protein
VTVSKSKASLGGKFLLGAALALIFMGGFIVLPQTTRRGSIPTFSVDVDVVNVFVTVRDKKGSFIRDLTRDDFTLSENGKKQDVRYFSQETDLPLTIGLIVDTTPSESNMMDEEKAASRVFLNKMLRKGKDNAFLIQFNDEVELLQDLTSSPEKIEEAIGILEQHRMEFPGMTEGKPALRRRPALGFGPNFLTILADSISLASDEMMKPLQGRKALIILGDGYHVGDHLDAAIAAAQQADTLIYTIRIYDKGYGGNAGGFGGMGPFGFPGGGLNESEWKENLKTFSRRTGGAYFESGKKDKLEQIYSKIEEELRSQYSLGYTPDDKISKGFRTIKVDVQKKGMVVRSRDGYYPRIK